jgi:predicted nuclease of predicted toxin-antitoxin system
VTRFLLDANISPETRTYLAVTFGFDVIDLLTEQQAFLPDEEVVALAKRAQRVLITHDLDFGELYHLKERGDFGVIILRLADQTVESVNRVLGQFFSDPATAEIPLTTSLVVIEEHRVRVVRGD